jgi:hypothetical protein
MNTRTKPYYSVRTGKNPLANGFDLDAVRDMFKTQFVYLEDAGYFQETLGYQCVDAGFVPGTLGHDLAGALFLELRKRELTPIRSQIAEYSEDDLFELPIKLKQAAQLQRETDGRGRRRLA